MNTSNYEIRAKARDALGNNIFDRTWLLALAAGLIISVILAAATSIGGIASILLTGPLYVGLHFTFLKIARKDIDIKFENVFDGCYSFGPNLVLGLMRELLITLWTFLFIIPGIIKGYSYSMAYFVKADYPEYGWRECLQESERLMKGNRLRLFSLHLSFIWWDILGIMTCGIGTLWVSAYKSTANAIFYEELKRSDMYN